MLLLYGYLSSLGVNWTFALVYNIFKYKYICGHLKRSRCKPDFFCPVYVSSISTFVDIYKGLGVNMSFALICNVSSISTFVDI